MNRELLEKEFDQSFIKQRQGRGNKMLDYLETHVVIQRLNDSFNGNWNFEVISHEILTTEVIVLGKLTTEGIIKTQFGSQDIAKTKDGKIISIGDDLKSAASDSIKKCATLFGVGLHLYGEAETPKEKLDGFDLMNTDPGGDDPDKPPIDEEEIPNEPDPDKIPTEEETPDINFMIQRILEINQPFELNNWQRKHQREIDSLNGERTQITKLLIKKRKELSAQTRKNYAQRAKEAFSHDYQCCECGDKFQGKPAGIHPTNKDSKFCYLCWEEYKNKHSRKCHVCNQPEYNCTC